MSTQTPSGSDDGFRPCPKCKQNMRFVEWSLEWDNTLICFDCRVAEEKRVYR